MSDLKIGRKFTLPPAIGTQTSAVVGIRGSGKTVTATVVVEELLQLHQQVVILDPTDAWWGLKSNASGSKAGFPVVIFGGPHGDLPLEPDMAGAIADFAVEQRVPMILSLRHLRKGKQQDFVTAFAEQLYHRKGEVQNRTPLLVAIDEASAFVPQRVGGSEARMVGAIEDLVRRGRSAGIGVMLIDQRPASVNKDVLTQLEVLVAHRITSPQDRKALDEWIKQHDTAGGRDTFLEQLSSLPQGVAWFWSPSLDVFERVEVRMRSTFDSSRTPKPGENIEAPRGWADVELEELRNQLSTAVEEAEANDPKALKRRIQELEAELANSPRGFDRAAVDQVVKEATFPLSNRVAQLDTKLSQAGRLAEQLVAVLRNGSNPITETTGTGGTSYAKTSVVPVPIAKTPAPIAEGMTEPEQRIVDALATYRAFGQEDVARPAVAAVAGYKQGGYFNVAVRKLQTRGYLNDPKPGYLAITGEGLKVANKRQIRSLQELHATWFGLTDKPQQQILEVLLDSYPQELSRAELAERSGFRQGGYFNVALKKLDVMGAAVCDRGSARASDLLFPAGLK